MLLLGGLGHAPQENLKNRHQDVEFGVTWKERHLPEINSEALINYFYAFLLY